MRQAHGLDNVRIHASKSFYRGLLGALEESLRQPATYLRHLECMREPIVEHLSLVDAENLRQ